MFTDTLSKTVVTFPTEGAGLSDDFRAMGSPTAGADGQPHQLFSKDMIKVGVYEHPFDGWKLEVTPERMDRWIASFKLMKERGVDVEVVKDHSFQADDAVGLLVDMYRGEDSNGRATLFGVHEIIGDDAIKLAGRVKNVSIWLERDFVDGTGHSFGEAIIHSSIVQQPIVPDQQGFVPIAASRGRGKAASMRLSLTGDVPMDIAKWRELLGAGDDLTDENLLERVGDRLSKLGDEKKKSDDQVTALSQDVEQLKGKITDLEAKAAGRGEPKVDPDAIEMMAEGANDKIDGLAAKGNITPAVAASLKGILVGNAGARNAKALSRTASGDATPLAKAIIEALAGNDPVVLHEVTRGQSLSRTVPGGGACNGSEDKDVVEAMTSGA